MSRAAAVVLLLTFLCTELPAQGPPVPDLRCVSVQGDTVTLTWTVSDSTLFDYYHIYYSYDRNNLAYSKLSFSVLNSEISYIYKEDNVQNFPVYYYMVSVGASESLHSDTLSTIFLNVTPLAGGSIAHLTWNDLSPNITGQYLVYRKDSICNWQYMNTVSQLLYDDSISYPYCAPTLLKYRVEIQDNVIGCLSCSTLASDYFSDHLAPVMVQMDTVSVDHQGNVIITWFPVTTDNISEYIIYRKREGISGAWDSIDAVLGSMTSYIDVNSHATVHSESYRVAAVDACGNIGLGGFPYPYSTLFLREIPFSYCDTQVPLSWTAATNLNPPVEAYAVYTYDPATSSTTFVSQTTDTTFIFAYPFMPDSTYCLFVRAYNNAGQSTSSCVQCFLANRPPQPDTLNFWLASVDTADNNYNRLNFYTDTTAAGSKAVILRKAISSDMYLPIDTIFDLTGLTDPYILYSDYNVNVNDSSYYYKIIILDDCDNESYLPDNEIRTMHLKGLMKDNGINWLYWNAYETTNGHVTAYELLRKIDGILNGTITLDPSTTTYDDDVSSLSQIGGRFSYLVRAVVRLSGVILDQDTAYSYSNETLVTQTAGIFTPNAFTPNGDGINDTFGPVNYFTDIAADYRFMIYNRWGQKIFETTDFTRTWDGTFKNGPAPVGSYVFVITYRTVEGLYLEKHGTVTLLR